MTQFGTDVTSAPEVPSYATPKEGVSKNAPFWDNASGMFDVASAILNNRAAAKNETVLSDFTRRQLEVADAYEQGAIKTSSHARTMLRKNLLDAIDSNPTLAADLVKAQSSILGLTGGGKIVDEQTRAQNMRESREDALIQRNLLPFNFTEQQFVEADSYARTAEAAAERYKQQTQTIDLQLKDLSLTQARRDELEAQKEEETIRFVKDMAPAEFQAMKNELNGIIDGGYTEAEKVAAIDELFADWQSSVSSMVGDLGSHRASAMLAPFQALKDAFMKRATGELTDAELQRSIDGAVNAQKLIIVSDPDMARIVAAQQMVDFGSFDAAIQSNVFKKFVEMVAGNSEGRSGSIDPTSPYSTDRTSNDALDMYFNMAVEGLNSSDPEVKANAEMHMQKIVEGLSAFEGLLRVNPRAGIKPVELLASNGFYRAVKDNPDAFTNIEDARQILERNYADEVYGMIQDQFRDNKVLVLTEEPNKNGWFAELFQGPNYTGEARDVQELVATRSTSSGMEFIPIDPENRAAVAQARKLNKDLKPVINTTLRAFAHLEGTNDYKAQWDKLSDHMIPTEDRGRLYGGDAGDNLNVRDFLSGISAVEPLTNEEVDTSRVGNVSFNGGGTMQPAGMIIHHTGGRGTVDGVVNTLQERGLSVQFVIDRNGKVVQLMPADTVAYHAGKNNNSGYDNNNTIGVEIIGADDNDITDQQVEAAKRLIRSMADTYGFDPMTSVFGHGQVATHKQKTEGQRVISSLSN